MIYLITNRRNVYDEQELKKHGIQFAKAKDFNLWFNNYDGMIQLDVETNMTQYIYDYAKIPKNLKRDDWKIELDEQGNKVPVKRTIVLCQIGDKEGSCQWLFDTYELSGIKLESMLSALKSDKPKIIHNAMFEYTTIKFNYGIDITNIHDTFLMSKLTVSGLKPGIDLEDGYNSLAGCAERLLRIELSKEEQTSFTIGGVMTPSQLVYGATDVAVMGPIYDALMDQIVEKNLENVLQLENLVVRPYGDAMVENFYLDTDKWKEIMELHKVEVANIQQEFYDLMQEYFKEECEELGFIQKDDEYLFNWRSRNKVMATLRLAYPNIPSTCTTVKDRKDFLKILEENDDNEYNTDILENVVEKNYEQAETLIISRYQEHLQDLELFIPKGNINLNLSSNDQMLKLFKLIKSGIENVNKETIKKLSYHPLAKKFQEYQIAAKLVTSYGENFLDALGPDNMLRINGIKQILDTGRTSLKMYQLLPSGVDMYRNCFYPAEGFKVVGVDYSSQEAVVAATVCGEQKLLTAIEKGYDFHSTCASLMFPETWAELGGEPEPKGKPKNKELLKLRQKSKVTSFGQSKN